MFNLNPDYTTKETISYISFPVLWILMLIIWSTSHLFTMPSERLLKEIQHQVERCYNQKGSLHLCDAGKYGIQDNILPMMDSEGFAVSGKVHSITIAQGIIEVTFIRGRPGLDGENLLILPYISKSGNITWQRAGSCQGKQCDLNAN